MLTYENPLITRYASPAMSQLWGAQRKFSTWRRLWLALAEAEAELGLPITQAQLDELRANLDNIDFDKANECERELRHDVMAHVHTYGDCCPMARPIIHLGATSCFVTDNADALLIRESLVLIRNRLAAIIDRLGRFALQQRDLPCLSFTHLQPAQPTTVGRRACLWAYDLILDLEEIEHRLINLKTLGNKGTTGTQASFLKLFGGDHGNVAHEKVRQLEALFCKKIGMESFALTGQTYPRKMDSQVLDVLSGIAQSSHKFANDMRILAHRKEMEEPFEQQQIGSSAMAYKRNPMRSERICALARFVMSLQTSPPMTVATQWMERTLDDSANRRLVLPQAFLAVDAVLILYQNIAEQMVVYPKVIEKNLQAELPFMATENLLMAAVARGGDRQDLHERIRQHSQAATAVVKNDGGENDLWERLSSDPVFSAMFSEEEMRMALNSAVFVGRSREQVDEFIAEQIDPVRGRYEDILYATDAEVRV